MDWNAYADSLSARIGVTKPQARALILLVVVLQAPPERQAELLARFGFESAIELAFYARSTLASLTQERLEAGLGGVRA